ncbi:MAG: hypothetical protein H7A23_19310 [Leptospiraceae bacterium]|nr:hypothetical protein [Leptospiraceae bacterium]MCP5496704.1 hypothetical protein [Leptospiraceae bacterium]
MNKYLFIFSILFSSGLFAQQTVQILTVCKEEKENFCSKNSNSNIEVIQCLLENESKLSKDCRKEIQSSMEKVKNSGKEDCKEDVKKHCRWTVPGGGRIIKCLLKNEKNLSKQCLKTLNDI